MTTHRSFWVVVYSRLDDNKLYVSASAYMDTSMLNALCQQFHMGMMKFYEKVEHSDMHWTLTARHGVGGHRTKYDVFMQGDMPPIDPPHRPVVVDRRDPDLLATAQREASGFKRIPYRINL